MISSFFLILKYKMDYFIVVVAFKVKAVMYPGMFGDIFF